MNDPLGLGFRLLLLLGAANSFPIIAKLCLGKRFSPPLDAGLRFIDGKPLLGPSKTVRGVLSALVGTALCGPLLGFSPGLAAEIAILAMAGDAFSSFVKRRLGIAASGRATGIDQVPEALLPLLAIQDRLALSVLDIAGITTAFFVLEIVLARILFRLGLRDRPY